MQQCGLLGVRCKSLQQASFRRPSSVSGCKSTVQQCEPVWGGGKRYQTSRRGGLGLPVRVSVKCTQVGRMPVGFSFSCRSGGGVRTCTPVVLCMPLMCAVEKLQHRCGETPHIQACTEQQVPMHAAPTRQSLPAQTPPPCHPTPPTPTNQLACGLGEGLVPCV